VAESGRLETAVGAARLSSDCVPSTQSSMREDSDINLSLHSALTAIPAILVSRSVLHSNLLAQTPSINRVIPSHSSPLFPGSLLESQAGCGVSRNAETEFIRIGLDNYLRSEEDVSLANAVCT
jgi:hypothetical protein